MKLFQSNSSIGCNPVNEGRDYGKSDDSSDIFKKISLIEEQAQKSLRNSVGLQKQNSIEDKIEEGLDNQMFQKGLKDDLSDENRRKSTRTRKPTQFPIDTLDDGEETAKYSGKKSANSKKMDKDTFPGVEYQEATIKKGNQFQEGHKKSFEFRRNLMAVSAPFKTPSRKFFFPNSKIKNGNNNFHTNNLGNDTLLGKRRDNEFDIESLIYSVADEVKAKNDSNLIDMSDYDYGGQYIKFIEGRMKVPNKIVAHPTKKMSLIKTVGANQSDGTINFFLNANLGVRRSGSIDHDLDQNFIVEKPSLKLTDFRIQEKIGSNSRILEHDHHQSKVLSETAKDFKLGIFGH